MSAVRTEPHGPLLPAAAPSWAEKGGGTFEGIKLRLCENPLPPLDEAVAAAQAEAPRGNF